ncbi:MAG: hypothetical protein ACKO37_07385 [Vampirovibrionales bacterium]
MTHPIPFADTLPDTLLEAWIPRESPPSSFTQAPFTASSLEAWLGHYEKGLKRLYIGLDIAPLEHFESGLCVLNEKLEIVFWEKYNQNSQLLQAVRSLGSPESVVIVADMPRPIQGSTRWRNELMKFRGQKPTGFNTLQDPLLNPLLAPRSTQLLEALLEAGYSIACTQNQMTKCHYGFQPPLRTRSMAGCAMMQTWLVEKLWLTPSPHHLPSQGALTNTLLEAALAAYGAWATCHGEENKHFHLHYGRHGYLSYEAIKPFYKKGLRAKRLFRYRRKF